MDVASLYQATYCELHTYMEQFYIKVRVTSTDIYLVMARYGRGGKRWRLSRRSSSFKVRVRV